MIIQVIEDGDDLVIPIPKEFLEELDWKEGDTLSWTENGDGSFTLSKKDV